MLFTECARTSIELNTTALADMGVDNLRRFVFSKLFNKLSFALEFRIISQRQSMPDNIYLCQIHLVLIFNQERNKRQRGEERVTLW